MCTPTKALIFPYNFSFASMLRQIKKQGSFDIVSAVTLGKWCEYNCDSSFLDEGPVIDVPLRNNLIEELFYVDVVIWASQNYSNNYELFEIVKSEIMLVLQKGKNVICCQQLSIEEIAHFTKVAMENKCEFYYDISTKSDYQTVPSVSNKQITIPVIVVSGIFDHCQVLDVVFYLKNNLTADNYHVSVIAPTLSANIVNCYSFFDLFNFSEPNGNRRIIDFQNAIRAIQDVDEPDAILIGLPNNLLVFNEQYPGDYGILAFEFFNAIHPDVSIVCVDCDSYSPDFEKKLLNIMNYRFNVDVDAICVSSVGINPDCLELDIFTAPEYNVYSLDDAIRKTKDKGEKDTYIINDEKSMLFLEQKIITLLT